MYTLARPVASWLAEGRDVHVALLAATRGFSSADPGLALAWTDDGERAGALFPGVDADLTAAGDRLDGRLVEVTVTDTDAVAAGLACGGVATVVVQDAARFPAGVWDDLEHREPLCVVTEIVGAEPGTTTVYTRSTVRDAVAVGGDDIPRLFARGVSAHSLSTDGDRSIAVVSLWPTTRLLVVGSGLIADALADIGAVLGWTASITNDGAVAGDTAATLTESDVAVVLSHDRGVDVPALAALIGSRVGYVGALGSRRTQAARREGLEGRGIAAEQLDRVHGPAGLDIDAHTPGEIAVAIIAEALAHRAGTAGGSISRRGGPIHTSGVHAPPPRHGLPAAP